MIRLAWVYLKPPPESGTIHFQSVNSTRHDVSVSCNHVEQHGESVRLLLEATASLPGIPDVNEHRLIELPDEPRMVAEDAIEATADCLAIAYGAARQLRSPHPCVGLRPESEAEELYLRSAAGLALEPTSIPSAFSLADLPLDYAFDRLDGASLLAQALTSGSALGEFHEHIRLFERAFARSGKRLLRPLATFLAGNDLGYMAREVRDMVLDTRNRSTHADRLNALAMERDVQRIIFRARQAAYDVLFNKERWHDPSSDRRIKWRPAAGLAAPATPFIRIGANATVRFNTLDEFHVFQMDMTSSNSVVPHGWFADIRKETRLAAGPIEVREALP